MLPCSIRLDHHHILTAEQATTSFLRLQRSWAIGVNCPWLSMSSGFVAFQFFSYHVLGYRVRRLYFSSARRTMWPRNLRWRTQTLSIIGASIGQIRDGSIWDSVNPFDFKHDSIAWSSKGIELVFHGFWGDPWLTVIEQNCNAGDVKQSYFD